MSSLGHVYSCALESFNLAGKFAAVRVKISALEKATVECNYILKVLSCGFNVCS